MRVVRLLPCVLVAAPLLASCASDPAPATRPAGAPATAPDRAAHPMQDDGHVVVTPESVRGVMYEKLAYTSALLEGLAIENFSQVEHNARQLSELSRQSDWMVHDTVSYTVLSREFRTNLDDLMRSARDRNADGAGTAYVQMVSDCITCHDYLRREGLWRQLPGAVSRSGSF